jgi:hypothetical protein
MDSTTKLNLTLAIISALATLAAAIIYYFTLRELKRQRENTYKPHLFIDDLHFNVQGIRKGNLIFPKKWGDASKAFDIFLEFTQENFSPSDFGLKCYNIGFGTAKKITITFSYDIDVFIEQVNKLNEFVTEDKRITVKKDRFFVSFDCKNKDLPFINSAVSIENVLKRYVSYILPVNIKSDYAYIKLPSHYLELLNIYVFLFSSIPNKKEIDIQIDIPIITSEIIYSDISNQAFSKNLTITTELSMLSAVGFAGQFKIHELQ